MSEDILRLKKQLAEFKKELNSEKEKQKLLLNELDDAIAILDGEGKFVLCNTAFRGIFGISSKNEVEGRPLTEFVRKPSILDLHELSKNSGKTVEKELELERGSGVTYSIKVTPKSAKVDKLDLKMGAIVILHDITRQKSVEKMRVDFVANVSHELKTPLTAISGFVETLLDGAWKEKDTAIKFLGTVFKHTKRMSRLIDDLLTLSHIELGDEKPNIADIQPETFLKSLEQVFDNSAKKKNISLDFEIRENTGNIKADRDRLTQILINLIDNALKHTPEKGSIKLLCQKLTVNQENVDSFEYQAMDDSELVPTEISANQKKEFIEFKVTDNGEGMPEKSVPRLMERFYRVDKARSRELGGTGLGLSIVKHLIIAHKGSIRIKSQLGKGTTVAFILPL